MLSYEKVRVPAGEFDAFKLEAKGNWVSPQASIPRQVRRDVLVRPRSARYREERAPGLVHAHLHH